MKAPGPDESEIKPLPPNQVRRALHTGLREGERLGLRWDDLDLESATPTLQVKRTLSETRAGHKFGLPKSAKGRSIKLSKKAVEALRSHRARRAGEKLRLL